MGSRRMTPHPVAMSATDLMVPVIPTAPVMLGVILASLGADQIVGNNSPGSNIRGAILAALGLLLVTLAIKWTQSVPKAEVFQFIVALCINLAAVGLAMTDIAASFGFVILAVLAGLLLIDAAWYYFTLLVITASWVYLAWHNHMSIAVEVIFAIATLILGRTAREARELGERNLLKLRNGAALTVLDPTTGLPDRNGVHLVAAQLVAIARREGGSVGCSIIEIGHYDQIVRNGGQRVADTLMEYVAAQICGCVRATDVVARWAPNQFAVIAHGHGATAHAFEERLKQVIDAECPVPPNIWDRTVQLARAVLQPWDDMELTSTLHAAEQALARYNGQSVPNAEEDLAYHHIPTQVRRVRLHNLSSDEEVTDTIVTPTE